jgi:hypothetical protein
MRRILCLLGVAFLLATGGARGFAAREAETKPDVKWTGSKLTITEAASRSNLIVVGKVTKVGNFNYTAPGQYMCQVDITISDVLKGDKVAAADFFITVMMGETTPDTGSEYVFFLKAGPHKYFSCAKLLPITEDNVKATKKVLADAATTGPTTRDK